MAKNLNLLYALKNGELVGVDDVESGLKCECVCPACGERLVAKKGTKTMHHFSHYSGHNCEHGYETSLHLAAKEILQQAKRIMLPAVYLNDKNKSEDWLISEPKEIIIDHVDVEFRTNNVIPDIVVHSKNKQLFIEILVTHRIDEQKLNKIKDAAVSTIEIDLSKTDQSISAKQLENILINEIDHKRWAYNSLSDRLYSYLLEISDKKPTISRGLASHADYCPISARVWRGKPYANVIDDCAYCPFHIDTEYELLYDETYGYDEREYIVCSGKHGISSYSDLKEHIKKQIQK